MYHLPLLIIGNFSKNALFKSYGVICDIAKGINLHNEDLRGRIACFTHFFMKT